MCYESIDRNNFLPELHHMHRRLNRNGVHDVVAARKKGVGHLHDRSSPQKRRHFGSAS